MIERSLKIKKRLFECLENGQITMGDEIEIIEYMVNRLNPISPAQKAKELGISNAGIKKRIESGKEAFITIGKQKFIL
jgi:hypothetical protein